MGHFDPGKPHAHIWGICWSTCEHTVILFSVLLDRCYSDKNISPICTGILIQILIQTGCVYTEAKWIQIRTQTTSPMWTVIQIRIGTRDLVLV